MGKKCVRAVYSLWRGRENSLTYPLPRRFLLGWSDNSRVMNTFIRPLVPSYLPASHHGFNCRLSPLSTGPTITIVLYIRRAVR